MSGGLELQLLVFDTRRGNAEGQEQDKLLACFPPGLPPVQQSGLAGLLHGLLLFTANFTTTPVGAWGSDIWMHEEGRGVEPAHARPLWVGALMPPACLCAHVCPPAAPALGRGGHGQRHLGDARSGAAHLVCCGGCWHWAAVRRQSPLCNGCEVQGPRHATLPTSSTLPTSPLPPTPAASCSWHPRRGCRATLARRACARCWRRCTCWLRCCAAVCRGCSTRWGGRGLGGRGHAERQQGRSCLQAVQVLPWQAATQALHNAITQQNARHAAAAA